MHARLVPLLLVPLLLAPPLGAAASHGGLVSLPREAGTLFSHTVWERNGDGYWAHVEAEPAQAPHEGSSYDCTGSSPPAGPVQSATWNVDHLLDGTYTWGQPYLNPRCVALDTGMTMNEPEDVSPALAAWARGCEALARNPCESKPWGAGRAGDGAWITPDARVTYNFTSGEYSVRIISPVVYSIQGTSGLIVMVDCHHCDPPW